MSDLKMAKKFANNLKVYKPELVRALHVHKGDYSFWTVFPLVIQFLAVLASMVIPVIPMPVGAMILVSGFLNLVVWVNSLAGSTQSDYASQVIHTGGNNLKTFDIYIKDTDAMIAANAINLTRLEAMRVQTVAIIAEAAKHDNQKSTLFELVNSNFKPIEVPK